MDPRISFAMSLTVIIIFLSRFLLSFVLIFQSFKWAVNVVSKFILNCSLMRSFILDTSGVIYSIIIDELSDHVMSLTKVPSSITVSLLPVLASLVFWFCKSKSVSMTTLRLMILLTWYLKFFGVTEFNSGCFSYQNCFIRLIYPILGSDLDFL